MTMVDLLFLNHGSWWPEKKTEGGGYKFSTS